MEAKKFDEHFDNGRDIEPFVELDRASRLNKVKRVNVCLPYWMVDALDREAKHLVVTRQSLVKAWLAKCLVKESRGQGA